MLVGSLKGRNMHCRGGRHTTGGHLKAPGKQTTRGAVTREERERCHTMEAEAKRSSIWRRKRRRWWCSGDGGGSGRGIEKGLKEGGKRGKDANKDPSG